MSRWAAAFVASLAGGCLTFPAFECESDDQCDEGGVCEPQGHCSYADPYCESGRRYGPHAGALAGECVALTDTGGSGTGEDGSDDGTGGTDGTGATDGGGTGTTSHTDGSGSTSGGGGCGTVGPVETIVDNDDPCFELHGPEEWWRYESAGYGGSLVWTYATDLADPTNYVVWRLTFEEAGAYRVEVYLDPQWGLSKQAAYEISHVGGPSTVSIDQSASSGWTTLGDFEFDYLGGQWVRLHDNTGEPNGDAIQLMFDALRVTRVGGGHAGSRARRSERRRAAHTSRL